MAIENRSWVRDPAPAAEGEARWQRLLTLLQPMHRQALATARRLCRSAADGDDLYQEAVLRAFEKLHSLRDEARFRPWFYAALLSRHRSLWRRALRRRTVPLEDAFGAGREPVGERGETWAEEAWRAARAAQALGSLPAVQREALVLFELDGFAVEEIAAMQAVSESAVKSRLARGREKLRRFYRRRRWRPMATAEPTSGRSAPEGDGETPGQGDLAFGDLAVAPAEALGGKERSDE